MESLELRQNLKGEILEKFKILRKELCKSDSTKPKIVFEMIVNQAFSSLGLKLSNTH